MHKSNTAVTNGEWGEAVAAEFLRRLDYEIIERNSRPSTRDQRLEIDIIAWDRTSDTMVFVEVKQHAELVAGSGRLRSVNRSKRRNLRIACNAWRRRNRWCGGVRFDVIEIYGRPGSRPYIDHIRDIELFAKPGCFVKWN